MEHAVKENHYRHLTIMVIVSFASMYVLMYAMVNRLDNVYNSVNQLYMAGLMTAPMALIELFVMRGMYHNKNWNVLVTGYFLVAREGFRLLQAQGRGGNLVFIASKNALVAGKNAAAYSTAKAAEAHLARCLAEEGGQFGIRVNTVNPDAVLAGSRIWDGAWRQERAATYGVAPDQLEEVYRKRTTLGVNILPEDIAEAVAFLASPTRSLKSTGNILNVDGGVAAAYPR